MTPRGLFAIVGFAFAFLIVVGGARANVARLPESVREQTIFENYGLIFKLDAVMVPSSFLTSLHSDDWRQRVRVFRNGKLVLDRSAVLRNSFADRHSIKIELQDAGHLMISTASRSDRVALNPRFATSKPTPYMKTVHVVTITCSPIVATLTNDDNEGGGPTTLSIRRDGKPMYAGPLDSSLGAFAPETFGCFDDDGERGILFDNDYYSQRISIFSYDPAAGSYRGTFRAWGVKNKPKIGIDSETGSVRFEAGDQRVGGMARLRNYPGPLRIELFRHNHFDDVTQKYPSRIAADAEVIRAFALTEVATRDPAGVCPSYLADEMNLGAIASARLLLHAHCSDTNRDDFRALEARLHALGYP